MRSRTITLTLLLAWSAAAPQAEPVPDPIPVGETVPHVPAEHAPEQSYALYLPTDYVPTREWPILYCFDPRGRGELCVDLYRSAAERLGYAIASSNNVRSDGPIEPNLDAMRAIWIDSNERLSIDYTRTYATGFSGGARIANLMGQLLGFAGVIAVGAGFPPSAPPREEIPFDFYALIGDRDFNYYEVRALEATLPAAGIDYGIRVFDGAHRWCPAELCGEALDWMELRAMQGGLVPRDQGFIDGLYERERSRAARLDEEGRPYEAWAVYQSIERDFAGLAETQAVGEARSTLEGSAGLKRERRERDRWQRRAQGYLDRLPTTLETITSATTAPPSLETLLSQLEIQELLTRARAANGTEASLSAERLLEMVYVQTAFTQVAPLLRSGQYRRAALALSVAVTIKPDGPNAWYNLACAEAMAGREGRALTALERAIEAGFDDTALLATDPDLASVRDSERFARLAAELGDVSE